MKIREIAVKDFSPDLCIKIMQPLSAILEDQHAATTLVMASFVETKSISAALFITLLAGMHRENMLALISLMADKSIDELKQLPISQVIAAINIGDFRHLLSVILDLSANVTCIDLSGINEIISAAQYRND